MKRAAASHGLWIVAPALGMTCRGNERSHGERGGLCESVRQHNPEFGKFGKVKPLLRVWSQCGSGAGETHANRFPMNDRGSRPSPRQLVGVAAPLRSLAKCAEYCTPAPHAFVVDNVT